MVEVKKGSRRKQDILKAVIEALNQHDYTHLTIEDIAVRAGVGKSTIYRWWGHKSELVFEAFKENTLTIFDLDYEKSLKVNLKVQLIKLSLVLQTSIGRALLVVLAEHREAAGNFFQQYLIPRRELIHKLIEISVKRNEIIKDYSFDIMLDMLYATVHYQIIFFNRVPDETYIDQLVDLAIQPALTPASM
nr:TetR/AcrR family transcriptional regulator [Acinetobacter sp. Marseille-Q1620]